MAKFILGFILAVVFFVSGIVTIKVFTLYDAKGKPIQCQQVRVGGYQFFSSCNGITLAQ